MRRYHTIVVGLGAVGSAAAHHLARAGHAVLGIDRFAPPHPFGSTHGETRITRLAIGEGAEYTPLAIRSHQLWGEIERETGTRLLHSCGGLILSNPGRRSVSRDVPDFFENTLRAAERHGVAHEVLDAAAIRRRFPQFVVRDHERAYHELPSGPVHARQAGYLMVEDCVRAQLELARRHGATLALGTTVDGFDVLADGGVEVAAGGARYQADHLLLSAGAWLPRLLGSPFQDLFRVTRQVLHWFEITSDPARFAPGTFPIFIWELPPEARGSEIVVKQPVYGFPYVGGRAVPAIKIATEQRVTADPDDMRRLDVSPAEIAAMHREYVAPYLRDVGPRSQGTAVCMYTEAPGGRFVIDTHPESDRVTFVSACSGHGFKHSPAIGEALAQRIATGASEIDLSPFRVSNLRR